MECSNRLDELVVKYENTLFRAALAILGDVQEAEDAVQDAFLKLMKGGVYFEDAASDDCKKYIVTVIRHSAIDIYNRKKREQEIICFLDGKTDMDRLAASENREAYMFRTRPK